jgi:hypothetical protein
MDTLSSFAKLLALWSGNLFHIIINIVFAIAVFIIGAVYSLAKYTGLIVFSLLKGLMGLAGLIFRTIDQIFHLILAHIAAHPVAWALSAVCIVLVIMIISMFSLQQQNIALQAQHNELKYRVEADRQARRVKSVVKTAFRVGRLFLNQ